MFPLLLLGAGWSDCVETLYVIGDPSDAVYAVARGADLLVIVDWFARNVVL